MFKVVDFYDNINKLHHLIIKFILYLNDKTFLNFASLLIKVSSSVKLKDF